jgi:8-amino-7-oxononanoate synthase
MPDLAARLAALEAAGLRRRLAVPQGLDLTSNDVLGLSRHPEVRDALVRALAELPHGGGASRLLTGQHEAWAALERRFAAWQGAEAALYFPTGYAANTGLLSSLPAPGDLVVCDALIHASLIDGVRLSKAEKVVVPHQDLAAAEAALARRGDRDAWVVVESVYSMDGDRTDLAAWSDLCERHGASLIVDEAHATGLFGPGGRGLAAELDRRPFATVHTCS